MEKMKIKLNKAKFFMDREPRNNGVFFVMEAPNECTYGMVAITPPVSVERDVYNPRKIHHKFIVNGTSYEI